MSRAKSQLDPWIARLQENLRNERYSRSILKSYTYLVRRFLRELEHRDQALESVSPGDVETYVEALRRKCTGKPAYSAQSEHRFQAIVNIPMVSAAGAADVGNLFTMRSRRSYF